jgi:hypothetical protein
VLVGRGLVPHPGDDGGLGPALDRDAFRPGYRAAAHRGRVLGYGLGQPPGQVHVPRVERQEVEYGPAELLDIVGLLALPAPSVRCPLPGVRRGGALGGELRSDQLDRRQGRPDAA